MGENEGESERGKVVIRGSKLWPAELHEGAKERVRERGVGGDHFDCLLAFFPHSKPDGDRGGRGGHQEYVTGYADNGLIWLFVQQV